MTIVFLTILAAVLVHLPVPAAAVVKEMHNIKDWGKPEYVHCVQPYTWHELVYGYKNGSVTFKMGGLGKMLENRGYETWQCFPDHYCAADTNNPWFCFVYHETAKVFTPWGENAQLQLVRVQGQDCPICEKKIAAAGGEPHNQTAQDPIYTLGERNEDCNEVCGSLGSGYTCDRVTTSNINTQQLLVDVLANVGHIVPQTALFSEDCGGGAWEGNAPFWDSGYSNPNQYFYCTGTDMSKTLCDAKHIFRQRVCACTHAAD